MKKLIYLFLILPFFANANNNHFLNQDKQEIEKSISFNNNVAFDIINFDKKDPNKNFLLAKKLSIKYPYKHFIMVFHKEASFNTIKNDKLASYGINSIKYDYSLIKNLPNFDFYVCKTGLYKRHIKTKDVDPIFDSSKDSFSLLYKLKKKGFLIIKEDKKIEK